LHTGEDGLLEWIPSGMQETGRSWVTELKGMCVARKKGLQEWKQMDREEWPVGTVRYKYITKVT
jgi:hypothetical protein